MSKAQQLDLTLEGLLVLIVALVKRGTGFKDTVRLRIRLKAGLIETWEIEEKI